MPLKNRRHGKTKNRKRPFGNSGMDRKVELVETDDGWSWFIMQYDKEYENWYTVETGTENTFVKACRDAYTAYDRIS